MRKIKVYPSCTPFIKFGVKNFQYYNGIRIKTDEGVHEQLMDLIKKSDIIIKGARVLDMGCGEGALSQRLADMGASVMSLDVDDASFRGNTQFQCIDFDNRDEVSQFLKENRKSFDLVIATEVIEHVHDPWELLANMRLLTKDGGAAVITTPNVSSIISRLEVLRSGNYFQFCESDLNYGHVTPVSMVHFKKIAEDTRWEIKAWSSGGCLPVIWLNFSFKYILFSIFSLLIRPFIGALGSGWCLMFVLIKK